MASEARSAFYAPIVRRLRSAGVWVRRVGLWRHLAIGLTVAAILSGVATYAALTGSPPFGPDPTILLLLIVLDLVFLLPLAVLVAYRVVRVWTARRKGSAGSRLHARLVLLFSVVAVIPSIIVIVFAALYFNFGIQAWHSERMENAMRQSLNFTDRVLSLQARSFRTDISGLVNEINRHAVDFMTDPRGLGPFVVSRAQAREFTNIAVFDGRGRVLVESRPGFGLRLENAQDLASAISMAEEGEVVLLPSRNSGKVRAIARLPLFFDSYVYLYVTRSIDPAIHDYAASMRAAIEDFRRLRAQDSSLQISFYALFGLVALLLLLAAVWLGLIIANHLARPISGLIDAAERVRAGDLRTRVIESGGNDELSTLVRSFNRMTGQLERNRRELIEANRQLDSRREFTETVLSGVSAGVIGLDADGRINLPNRSASALLDTALSERIGEPVLNVLPELEDMFAAMRADPERAQESEISLLRGGRGRRLLVRMAAEKVRGEVVGYVVTFDDVTELVAAQRKAAWADVARRIAHEIKNPLTPIQLSAERLRRKYRKDVADDPETFDSCTETIIRQVGDIGRLVDEFSAFARMPAPVMEKENLVEIVHQALSLQRGAHSDIAFHTEMPANSILIEGDSRQLRQAVTNLLQNAVESVKEADVENPAIRVEIKIGDDDLSIDVTDNGPGFPEDDLVRLTEPYVTSRPKGTGLGLAIALKIMEDHGGQIVLENVAKGGARARLVFSRDSLVAIDGSAPEAAAE